MSFEKHKNKPPVRLRPVTEKSIGTTFFFRNRSLFSTLLSEMALSPDKHYRILFHACSIGVEVYSFVIQYLSEGYANKFNIQCYGTDIEEKFLGHALRGIYPKNALQGMYENEAHYFDQDFEGARVKQEVMDKVEFLDAASFVQFTSTQQYDVVFLLNCLVYVPADEQAKTIDRIALYNTEWLSLTACHEDNLKDDIVRNGYQPFTKNIREIHDSWLDRRVDKSRDGELVPGKIFAAYSLPSFQEIPEYEYKYCCLFRKTPLALNSR